MITRSPLDDFRAVLSGAVRAIAEEPEVELAWTAEAPSHPSKRMKLPKAETQYVG